MWSIENLNLKKRYKRYKRYIHDKTVNISGRLPRKIRQLKWLIQANNFGWISVNIEYQPKYDADLRELVSKGFLRMTRSRYGIFRNRGNVTQLYLTDTGLKKLEESCKKYIVEHREDEECWFETKFYI